MTFVNRKSSLCLLLVTAVFVSLLAGCHISGLDSSGTTQSTLDSTTNATGDSQGYDFPTVCPTVPTNPGDDGIYLNLSPNDPFLANLQQWAVNRISLSNAWDITTGSATIRVGVIDSGVDASHPDLVGRINATLSESFVSGVSPLEDHVGHGTHVAGIIGACSNNNLGITGVCWNVEIVSLRVVDANGYIDHDALIAAIESANSKGLHILNISLGTYDNSKVAELYDAVTGFDGLVVCAVGNDDVNTDYIPQYPACLLSPDGTDIDNLLSVGASSNADLVSFYSNYGEASVDIFAPGSSILSCYPFELCCANVNCSAPNHQNTACDETTHTIDGYHAMSGTSMAAPHVAGVAALLLSIHPELTPAELKQIIMSSVDIVYDADANSVFGDKCVSGGRLNAFAALDSALTHDFTVWTSVNGVIHSRTCTTCGYTQTGRHSDSWDALFSRCIVCRYKGIAVAPIESIPPAEDSAA